jgi:hypothetical protein
VTQAVDEYRHDVLVLFESSPGDGLRELGNGVQQVLGADVVADRAVGDGGVEQRREGGSEPLHEVAGEPGECGVA